MRTMMRARTKKRTMRRMKGTSRHVSRRSMRRRKMAAAKKGRRNESIVVQ
jgi:hypothetical protein